MKKKQIKLFLQLMALMLALLTFAGALAACKTEPPAETPTETTERKEGDEKSYYPLSGDYGGRSFSLLTRKDTFSYEFDVKELGTDEVENAIYARNTAIENAYNVCIDVTLLNNTYQSDQLSDRLNNLYASGSADEDYDLIGGNECRLVGLIPNGWFQDWNDMNYVDLDADVWTNGVTEGLTVNGQTYAITGDLAITFWKHMGAMVFNKDWVTRVWNENLYQVVNDGRWTYEYFKEAVMAGSDNDGESPDAGDKTAVYGFSSDWDVAIDSFVTAFNINPITKDESGRLSLSNLAGEQVVNYVTEMQYFYTSDNHYAWAYKGVDPSFYFRKNQAMIVPMRFEMIERMLDWDGNYGVIPYPKYNSQQQEYAAPLSDGSTIFAIPKTNQDTDFTCIITSALAEKSAELVIPAYYEQVIRSKGAKDPQSYQMLDLIRETITIDLSVLYSIAPVYGLLRNTINAVIRPAQPDSKDYMSNYESQLPAAQEAIQKFNDFYFGAGS